MLARLLKKIDKNGEVPSYRPDLGPCWIWTACKAATGYGRCSIGHGITRNAHRVVYESLVGPIPDGLDLDHICRNRGCVNPDHLEPVTRRINTLRGFNPPAENAQKTHCPQGHPYDEENTAFPKRGGRACRECMRQQWRARYWSTPEQKAAERKRVHDRYIQSKLGPHME